ncbi:MAG: galactose mutarotase [Balneolaceae bacterium]|nr:MAG: galactose mutarotase [Balneolaceae bacterium]
MACSKDDSFKLADGVTLPLAENFVKDIDGKTVSLYTLQNQHGLRADITNYGGRIVSLLVPDKDNVFDDIVTGYHTIDEFIQSEEAYFGALIGRYGNRIGQARFEIDGEEYELNANNGPNSLHGGPGGFHNVVWDAEQPDGQTLVLTYLSPHLEEGFPGNLQTTVTYVLNDDNELVISYHAETDRATHINLTSHAFFNLAGEGSSTINDHFLRINADHFTPVDESLIPTGEIQPVENTPLDFREYHQIGERIQSDHPQMVYGNGYDHNFVLNPNNNSDELNFAASVYDPVSRRKMEVYTSEPGMQFYGGNFLSGNEVGKRGEPYLHRSSFCLETQHFPDSPNQPGFPSTLLLPGEEYYTTTVYKFSVKSD